MSATRQDGIDEAAQGPAAGSAVIDFARVRLLAALLAATGLSLAFIFGRHLYAERGTYDFLAWNLFLAWIPMVFALFARWLSATRRAPWLAVIAAAAWFVFLPNSPYIVTDLMHLRGVRGAPLWMDLLLVASVAWTGLVIGVASMRVMHLLALDVGVPRAVAAALIGVVSFASAFGVFIGRFLRWNSWDVVTNPGALAVDTWRALSEGDILVFTLAFGLFLWVAYLVVYALGADRPGRRSPAR